MRTWRGEGRAHTNQPCKTEEIDQTQADGNNMEAGEATKGKAAMMQVVVICRELRTVGSVDNVMPEQ